MDELDDLLNDLQAVTVKSSYQNSGPPQPAPVSHHSSRTVNCSTSSVGGSDRHTSGTPPPLPPPPQDLPDTIPPPQQFGDQPLYEAQQIKAGSRVSSSSNASSRGSGDHSFHSSKQPPVAYQEAPPRGYPTSSGGVDHGGPQQEMSMISNNLSELDQLLQDLNSAQFMAEVDKKQPQHVVGQQHQIGKTPPAVAPKPGRPSGGGVGPDHSVDNLLDQLESSVPQPTDQGGYPIQTNTVNYSYQPGNDDVSYSQVQRPAQTSQPLPPPTTQSSMATRELDDLMANLSEFKMVGSGPQHQGRIPAQQGGIQTPYNPTRPRSPSPGSEPSYAKPHKSRNLSQSSSGTNSLQSGSQGTPSSSATGQGGQLESMLGDLQSDMSRQGVNTKTKGLCAACNQPVVGQVITALGKIWHIEHFNCAHCHEALGARNFYERDGVAYCERDYHSLFAPRCGYCNGPIVDKCVTALNNTWHPEHFFCSQCGRPFGDDGFHEKDGKAYCKADYFEMFAPKCGGCGQAIVDNYISALNRHWHPECFACWDCHQPFGAGSFFDHEGLPYCETHYHAKKGSLCAGCQKPITGRCITAMYKKFHPEHFVCAFCLKQLNKGTFKEQNDKPYCHPCFVKLFG